MTYRPFWTPAIFATTLAFGASRARRPTTG